MQQFHAAFGRGINTHEFNVKNAADNFARGSSAVGYAGIEKKMLLFGTFRAIVRLSEAVRTTLRACSAFFRFGISELTLVAVDHTGARVAGSVQEHALVTERAVLWRSTAFFAVRTALTTAFVRSVDEEPRGTVLQTIT